ncbi:MAG: hypothetical protein CVU39_07445 [Chloroflexi bacterium HGW-Chloroflexi-10]|nr:MAG: hypothetical protein CVU39_07445 [Chloroflexi bacterium HGW-Chloroflexi-10]
MRKRKRVIQTIWHLFFLLMVIVPAVVLAQDESPWSEVFDADGNLLPGMIDLGMTTENPAWMNVDLPFDQSLSLEANYHRFQTPSGNIVVLPSASTLFFMAMNPQESGLANSIGMVGNGYGSIIAFLGNVAGDSVDWQRLQQAHPEYQQPEDFWNAVINGQENVWSWFSGFGFLTNLISLSWNDAALRFMYLMYLNGAQDCASIPGGCAGVAATPPPPRQCPDTSITMQQPAASIQKIAPNNPLVVGQDTQTRRGADVQVSVVIPPVIFTWYEPIYEEYEVCATPTPYGTPVCTTESIFKECRQHIEQLPDSVASLQASASLSADSKAWIQSKLGQTHYGAYVHQESFTLFPGYGHWAGGCDNGGTCRANGTALQIPFADPGTFNLQLRGTTSGTSFMGMLITQPRTFNADGTLQVYVTLPALVP